MTEFIAHDTGQVDWIGGTAPFQPHSETSKAAAESILDDLNRLQRQVLDFLRRCPKGATDEEIQVALDMNPSTQRPRRIELQRKGLVLTHGKRKTRSGRPAIVWKAA